MRYCCPLWKTSCLQVDYWLGILIMLVLSGENEKDTSPSSFQVERFNGANKSKKAYRKQCITLCNINIDTSHQRQCLHSVTFGCSPLDSLFTHCAPPPENSLLWTCCYVSHVWTWRFSVTWLFVFKPSYIRNRTSRAALQLIQCHDGFFSTDLLARC